MLSTRCILLLAVLTMHLYSCSNEQQIGTFFSQYPSEYLGLAQDVADLPIQCLNNSKLARTARVKVFSTEDGSRHATVLAEEDPTLDSNAVQVTPCTTGQILNAIPHEFVKPLNHSKSFFWSNFGLHCGIPLAFFGIAALFSTYVRKLDLEKFAFFTGVWGGAIGIGASFCSLYFDSNLTYKKKISRVATQEHILRSWLIDHVRNAGLYQYASERCGYFENCELVECLAQDALVQYKVSHFLGTEFNKLLQTLNQNERHLYRALKVIESEYAQRKQPGYYRSIHYKTNAGRFLGGLSIACLAGFFSGNISKSSHFTNNVGSIS